MSHRLRILYVDDEPDIRTIVQMALGIDPELDVHVAESGQAALALLANDRWRPDIALLDMMMPEMSGSELAGKLRDMPDIGAIPILFVTASARQADIDHYLATGGDGVITKPFEPLGLATNVRAEYARIIAR